MIHKKVYLKEGDNTGKFNIEPSPYFHTYILDDKSREAVLICPGGGYAFVSEREAEAVALQFNAAGFHAFILYYSTATFRAPQQLIEISRAMSIIRQSSDCKIKNNKIAVCGFSAGGHLAASLGVSWQDKSIQEAAGVINDNNKPDALILCYPVISFEHKPHSGSIENLLGQSPSKEELIKYSLEKQVNKNVPPVFIWHTQTDPVVSVDHSLYFVNSLCQKEIPFELHIFPDGEHGLSLANEETWSEGLSIDPHVGVWIDLCKDWLKNIFKKNK